MQTSTIIRDLPGYWLVLDASCPTTRVALFYNGTLCEVINSEENAMQSLLSNVKQLLDGQAISMRDIRGFIYCIGPGSILGIRLSVISIKTWCSVHKISPEFVLNYHSLAIAAAAVAAGDEKPGNDYAVISEWKKNHWNVLKVGAEGISREISIWDDETALNAPYPLFQLPQRKLWTNRVSNTRPIAYDLDLLASPEMREQLLSPMKNWEIYTPEKKDYVKWSGERHR